VTCLIAGLMKDKHISKVLIICPVSVLQSWLREINDHLKPYVKSSNVDVISSELPKKKRERLLRFDYLLLYIIFTRNNNFQIII
jgi:SNF2 family DNA or RNA helicase